MDTTGLLVRPLADAFLEVGVWVGVMVALFGLVQWRTQGGVERWMERNRRLGPLAGAILGVTPGCGGAILVIPLFRRGSVSFGTVVAALVATMGDSSFVIIAAAPRTALILHLLLLVVGLLCGVVVDLTGLRPPSVSIAPATSSPLASPARTSTSLGAAAAEVGLTGRLEYRFPSPALTAFWSLVAVGCVISAPVVFGAASAEQFAATWGLDPTLGVGAAGAAVSLVTFIRAGGRFPDGGPAVVPADPDPVRRVLRHGARETAFVTTWVSAAFLAFAWLEAAGVSAPGWLPAAGMTGVVAAAMIGLVPGCGPQIVLTGLYAQGLLPFSVLTANALSQDGDAILPLLATDRRAAIVASALTTVPGVAVGSALLATGW